MKKIWLAIVLVLALVVPGIASYVVMDSNTSTITTYQQISDGEFNGQSQGFTGDGNSVTRIRLYLGKHNSPSGNYVIKIYNNYEGTWGEWIKPTGSEVATSSSIAGSSFPSSPDWVDFDFTTPYATSNGTHYVFALEGGDGDSSNYVNIGCTSTSLNTARRAVSTGLWGYGYNTKGFYVYYTSDITEPSVTTSAASSVSTTTATGNGNVTATGGATVTAWGVCWGTSANPTTAGDHAAGSGDGQGGSFTASITSLTERTLYHVRAYATNSVGTAYGDDVTFTTLGTPTTFYLRQDGTAASLSAATGPANTQSACMNVSVHNAATTLIPGDTVKLSSQGGTITTTIKPPKDGSSGSPITYTNETSETPVIDTSIAVTSWTDAGGGIYTKASARAQLFYEDDVMLLKESSSSLTEAGSWYQDGSNGGTLYYMPSTGVPTDHTTKRVSTDEALTGYGFNLNNRNYITIQNISMTKHYGAVQTSAEYPVSASYGHIIVQNCTITNSLAAIDFRASLGDTGNHVSYCQALNNNISYCASGIRLLEEGGGYSSSGYNIYGEYITISGNQLNRIGYVTDDVQTWHNIDAGQDLEAISWQSPVNCLCSDNVITHSFCTVFFPYLTDSTAECVGNVITRNYAESYGHYCLRFTIGGTESPGYEGNYVTNNIFNGANQHEEVGGYSYKNKVVNLGDGSHNDMTGMNYFLNNTIYHWLEGVLINYNAGKWTVKNNIVTGPTGMHMNYPDASDDPTDKIIIDYNCYYPDGADRFHTSTGIGTGSDMNFANWQYYSDLNCGTWDAHGFIGDPLFVDSTPNEAVGVKLQSGSPAAKAGTDVDLATDFAGNPWKNPPSMGAYQYFTALEQLLWRRKK